jgi:hypothetical protein
MKSMSEINNPQVIRRRIIRIELELNKPIPQAQRFELEQELNNLENRLEGLAASTTSPGTNIPERRSEQFKT